MTSHGRTGSFLQTLFLMTSCHYRRLNGFTSSPLLILRPSATSLYSTNLNTSSMRGVSGPFCWKIYYQVPFHWNGFLELTLNPQSSRVTNLAVKSVEGSSMPCAEGRSIWTWAGDAAEAH